jgi:hypothetical protein
MSSKPTTGPAGGFVVCNADVKKPNVSQPFPYGQPPHSPYANPYVKQSDDPYYGWKFVAIPENNKVVMSTSSAAYAGCGGVQKSVMKPEDKVTTSSSQWMVPKEEKKAQQQTMIVSPAAGVVEISGRKRKSWIGKMWTYSIMPFFCWLLGRSKNSVIIADENEMLQAEEEELTMRQETKRQKTV